VYILASKRNASATFFIEAIKNTTRRSVLRSEDAIRGNGEGAGEEGGEA